MKTVSCCFTVFLVTTNPATSVIYSLKFVSDLQFLGTDFHPFSSSHCRENQPVLWFGI